jgi:prophage regulatory protein
MDVLPGPYPLSNNSQGKMASINPSSTLVKRYESQQHSVIVLHRFVLFSGGFPFWSLHNRYGGFHMSQNTTTDRIVRPAEAVTITGRSLASIWRDEQAGTFPPRIRIGQNAVGYRLSALQDWLDSREIITTDNVKSVAPGARRGRKPSASREA